MAARSSPRPAGSPVTIATSAGPCDSPAVVSESFTRQSLDQVAGSSSSRREAFLRANGRAHDLKRRCTAGPELERRSPLGHEDVETVANVGASRARRCGGGTVRVGKVDERLARPDCHDHLVFHRGGIDDEVGLSHVRRPGRSGTRCRHR